MKEFTKISPEKITENTFELIGTNWMLITAGTSDSFNTMTASWGGFGVMWFKPVVFIVVRPQRHTFNFIEKHDFFTLSFLHESDKDILQYCGTHSGKEVDKIAETGLRPIRTKNGAIIFDQAKLALECKKIYFDDFKKENFLDIEPLSKYANNDFHRLYIAEITECFKESI